MQGDETSLVRGHTGLAVVCHLLGVEESQFRTWLCSHKVVATRETFTKPTVEANRAKDQFLLARSVQWQSEINKSRQ